MAFVIGILCGALLPGWRGLLLALVIWLVITILKDGAKYYDN